MTGFRDNLRYYCPVLYDVLVYEIKDIPDEAMPDEISNALIEHCNIFYGSPLMMKGEILWDFLGHLEKNVEVARKRLMLNEIAE